MGSCFSKKNACEILDQPKTEIHLEKKKTEEVNLVKKEIFVIKHRNSHEIQRQERSFDEEKSEPEKPDFEKGKNVISCNGSDGNGVGGGAPPVRTSSCTKEEVDAILIQCGRLSRSYSTGKSISSESGGRKYSGSKRSYDFDSENGNEVGEDTVFRERDNRRIERRRQSPMRRRTLSSEREQQRSGSRERGGGSGGRRVSRSPGRRSESPIKNSNSYSSAAINGNSRPGKMVSVPATNKINNAAAGGDGGAGEVKRIEVKRNVGGSPRTRSPSRMRGSNENMGQNQQLSRSNSRKAEHSPHRRNPLAEIDTSTISQKPNAENKIVQVSENRNNNLIKTTNANCKNHQEHNHPMSQEAYGIPGHVALSVISSSSSSSSGPENLKNQPLTRTRSSRRSRDLDINPETLSNPNTSSSSSSSSSSYTALLLEDIQNFHHKNTPPPPAFILPPCVIKACSILEAVADLNFSPGSNQSQTSKINKSKPEINKDPILESEVLGKDDLMEPSFHKYVTVRRGGGTSGGEEDMEDQESSGSNSFVTGIGQQHWVSSSSCWEPNSAERGMFSASS